MSDSARIDRQRARIAEGDRFTKAQATRSPNRRGSGRGYTFYPEGADQPDLAFLQLPSGRSI
jgi:hypothetical protein